MTARVSFWVFAFGFALAIPCAKTTFALGDSAKAGDCSFASVGESSGNSIICNFGLTPEQLKEVTKAAVEGATGPLIDRIANVSKTLGVTEDAAKTLLKVVGEDSNIPEDRLVDALSKVAADYKRLQAQAAALNPESPTAHGLVEKARSEIDAGRLVRAHELLRQAAQVQVAAAQEAEKLERQAHEARDAQMLGAADVTAADAEVAMTERDYLHAADVYGQAVNYVPADHPGEHGNYLLREADALYRQGQERRDNAALKRSIDIYMQALGDYPRHRAPLIWAATQNNLGNALRVLGGREKGTETLQGAAAAYREALKERTRDVAPLDWATTQDALGHALWALGARESGTETLQMAVAAYGEALKERTRNVAPLDWAATQDGLGAALLTLGRRESGTETLQRAALAYGEALKERTRDRAPLPWAATQNNLGNVFRALGLRESGTESLQKAVMAYQEALKEWTRDRVPAVWATIQSNLGETLVTLGNVTAKHGDIANSYVPYEEGLNVFRELMHWASNANDQTMLHFAVERSGDLAYHAVISKDFSLALAASDLAISANTNELWLLTNRAHALMYLHRSDEAREIYLAHRGEMTNHKTWEAATLDDFKELREAGLTDPLMNEITTDFAMPK